MSTDVKLGKAQISRIIQSTGSFRSWLDNLRKKAQTSIVIPLPRDNLFGLIGNVTSNALNIFERKLSVKGCVRAGKGFFFNEDIKIIKWLEDLGVFMVLLEQ